MSARRRRSAGPEVDDGASWCAFFWPEALDVDEIVASDMPWSRRFVESEEAWILQSYLRLREAGYPVELCGLEDAASHDVVIAHPSRIRSVRSALGRRSRTKLVVTASDKVVGREADVVIVQNMGMSSAERRNSFVPHWPQPDLVSRDISRQGVSRAAFKGHPDALHADLGAASWAHQLSELGVEWSVDLPHDGRVDEVHPWSDYSACDIVVALRAPTSKLATKPATKLVNAWLAGVPAVLGHEPAYREMRCCELDYLEAGDAHEALSAVDRLMSDPELYERMTLHGRERGVAFDVGAVTARWVTTILEIRSA